MRHMANSMVSNGLQRRELLARMGTGLVVLTIHSAWGEISPAEARARGIPLRHFSATEGQTLEALADALLPGAREAGMAHYVDDQLRSANPLFFLKYMDYPGAYRPFYTQGLRALEQQSQLRYQRAFAQSTAEEQAALLRDLAQHTPPGWDGPPAPLFYFVTRNDAVDVYYGTLEGFARLQVPYMAHILPPERW
jgi:hypothetical protein